MGKVIFSLPDDVEKRLRDHCGAKYGRTKRGRAKGLSVAATEAINEWLKREAWKNRSEKGG